MISLFDEDSYMNDEAYEIENELTNLVRDWLLDKLKTYKASDLKLVCCDTIDYQISYLNMVNIVVPKRKRERSEKAQWVKIKEEIRGK